MTSSITWLLNKCRVPQLIAAILITMMGLRDRCVCSILFQYWYFFVWMVESVLEIVIEVLISRQSFCLLLGLYKLHHALTSHHREKGHTTTGTVRWSSEIKGLVNTQTIPIQPPRNNHCWKYVFSSSRSLLENNNPSLIPSDIHRISTVQAHSRTRVNRTTGTPIQHVVRNWRHGSRRPSQSLQEKQVFSLLYPIKTVNIRAKIRSFLPQR